MINIINRAHLSVVAFDSLMFIFWTDIGVSFDIVV